jgi:hypothetical protein
MVCRSFFVLLYFFFWSLCCLFFFDIRILITLWYLQTLLLNNTSITHKSNPVTFYWNVYINPGGVRVAQWVRSLDLTAHTSLSPIRRGFAPIFVNYKKGALDSLPLVIKFASCLPRVGGSLRVLRLPPPLKLVAMI